MPVIIRFIRLADGKQIDQKEVPDDCIVEVIVLGKEIKKE